MALGATILGLAAVASADGGTAVARVQDTAFSVSEVEARLARIAPYQLKQLGNTPDEIKARFVDELVKAELFARGAQAEGLDARPDVHDRIRAVYVSALLSDLRSEALAAGQVSDEEIRAYYEANKSRYASQKRIQIWQIVVDSPAKAEQVFKVIEGPEYAKDPVGTWDKLAREHSIDKTTAMSKGNIGFVQPDGSTPHKDVHVPKELYALADTLKDGEVATKPLRIGDYYVIIQRRGAVNTPERSLESEAKVIAGLLSKQKVHERRTALLDELRERWVTEKNPNTVDAIEVTPGGSVAPQERPGTLRRESHPAAGSPRPAGPSGAMR